MNEPTIKTNITEMVAQLDERKGCTSASNAEADSLCPGRHLAQRGLQDQTSKDAAYGTVLHDALCTNNPTGLDADQSAVFDACKTIEENMVNRCFGEQMAETPNIKPKAFREQRYWVKVGQGGNLYEHSGKPDVVYRMGPYALVLDYKTLFGDITHSPKNMQLRDLAVLVRGHFMVQAVAVAIIQPNVTMEPELCVYDTNQLKQAEVEMFQRVVASNNPNSERKAGEKQCRYCLAKMHCSEYQRWAGTSVPAMGTLMEVPVIQWTPEQRAIFCQRKSIARDWIDRCEQEIKALLEKDPTAVPGWKLKPGAIKETITNPQEVFDRLQKLGGNLSQFLACIDVGKTKLKDVVKTCTRKKGKALEKEMDDLISGCSVTSQNRPSLTEE